MKSKLGYDWSMYPEFNVWHHFFMTNVAFGQLCTVCQYGL